MERKINWRQTPIDRKEMIKLTQRSDGHGFLQADSFLIRSTEIQQHLGLLPNVPDWRLAAWSIYFHPILAYLYWNMNYHIDHHMYAGVPFYNVPKLHKLLEHDLPKPINGYLAGIRKILDIQKMQKQDPNYQYMPEFPKTANPPVLSA